MATARPDGLFETCFGPYEGKIADDTMLQNSSITDRLDGIFRNQRRRYYLFGDKACIHRVHIMSPHVGYVTRRNKRFNKGMSSARDTVELGYGKTQPLWMSNGLKQQSKMVLQPVGVLYRATMLLTNRYTCFRGNEDATRLKVRPPNTHQHLNVIA